MTRKEYIITYVISAAIVLYAFIELSKMILG